MFFDDDHQFYQHSSCLFRTNKYNIEEFLYLNLWTNLVIMCLQLKRLILKVFGSISQNEQLTQKVLEIQNKLHNIQQTIKFHSIFMWFFLYFIVSLYIYLFFIQTRIKSSIIIEPFMRLIFFTSLWSKKGEYNGLHVDCRMFTTRCEKKKSNVLPVCFTKEWIIQWCWRNEKGFFPTQQFIKNKLVVIVCFFLTLDFYFQNFSDRKVFFSSYNEWIYLLINIAYLIITRTQQHWRWWVCFSVDE